MNNLLSIHTLEKLRGQFMLLQINTIIFDPKQIPSKPGSVKKRRMMVYYRNKQRKIFPL